MKAIILARVSDKKQDSNEAQLGRISDYVRHKNLTVWKTYEIEESSTKGDREKFQDVVIEIKKSREPIALVVDTVDRLQRSFKESVLLDDLRKEGKLEIHFYRENLVVSKNSNSADLLRWDMAVMFARSYVLQLSDNVKRKFEQKRRNGELLGKAPIGYKNIGEKIKDVIPDPATAHHVKKIFELYATGNYSIQAIQEQINKEGLRSYIGAPLAPSMVDHILNNPFYYGEMRSGGKLYLHKYLPLISWDLFRQCQAVRDGWNKKPFQYAAKPFIFRGLLRCANCGCTISPEIKKGRYVYYSCTNAKRICKRVYVPEKDLLQPVYKALRAFSRIPQATIDEVVNGLKESNDSKNSYHKTAITALRQEYDAVQTKLQRMTDLLIDGGLSTEMYEAKVKEFKIKQHDINMQIEDHTAGDEQFYITASTVLHLAKNAFELFKSSEVPEKRAILNYLFQNCTLDGKTLIYQLKTPYDHILGHHLHSKLPLLDTFRTLNWTRIRNELEFSGLPTAWLSK